MPIATPADPPSFPVDQPHDLSAWKVTAVLWGVRWAVILPLDFIVAELAPQASRDAAATNLSGNLLWLLLILVLAGPLIETLIECSLPYLALSKIARPMSRGLFLFVSAAVVAVLHLVSWLAVVNAFITGAFIDWYALRQRGHGSAILHATAFHSAINLVGWVMLLASRLGA